MPCPVGLSLVVYQDGIFVTGVGTGLGVAARVGVGLGVGLDVAPAHPDEMPMTIAATKNVSRFIATLRAARRLPLIG
jgi:hypothetical protein